MKAIIFGSNGQDGYFLSELLTQSGIEVLKVSRQNAALIGDVSDYLFVYGLISEHLPDYVFHLAASSSTSHTFLFDNNASISNGTINILESVRIASPLTKVFLSGSAVQFKNSGEAINEETDFYASSHYAFARIHSVYAGRYYRDYFNLKVYVGYFFNHDSELRSPKHVNQKIINELRLVKEGRLNSIVVGNPDVKKEFSFAGDIVKAVWMLVNQDKIFEAVIGSGVAYSIMDWIRVVCDLLEINFDELDIETDANFNSEYKILVSDPEKIKNIGWQPSVTLEQLAERMLNY